MNNYNNPQRNKNGDSRRTYLKDKGIWIFCLVLFCINGIISIFNKDYYYLIYSILAIGFISSNVLLKTTKPQKLSIIIQLLMIVSFFIIKIMKIESLKLLIVFCISIIIIYGYILIQQLIRRNQ